MYGVEKVPNNHCYNSEYLDKETGYYYLRARNYNPATGTFIEEDTYEGDRYDARTLHKYLFAGANPIVYEDPTGEFFDIASNITAISIKCTKVAQDCKRLHTLIKVMKTATVIAEFIKICVLFYDMSLTNDFGELWEYWASVMVSLCTIIAVITDIAAFAIIADFCGIVIDIKELIISIIDAVSVSINGDDEEVSKAWKQVMVNAGLLLFDILLLFVGEGFDDWEFAKNNTLKRTPQQESLFELGKMVLKNGYVSDEIKQSLLDWADFIKCYDDIRLLFQIYQ